MEDFANEHYFGDMPIEAATIPDAPIITESIQNTIDNPQHVQYMLEEIDRVNEYAWQRGSMGLDMGFENLNKAFRGLNPGLHLVAGGANSGRHLTKKRIVVNFIP